MEAATGPGLSGPGLTDRALPPWRAVVAFALLWGCQWIAAGLLPLQADEAYYLSWSRDLRLGYLDHPPGVAWWIALGGGFPRLPGLVLMPVAWWLLADAARRWGAARWAWLPAILVGTPLGFVAGPLITPDIPLVFAWCVLLWFLARGSVVGVGVSLAACLWAKSVTLVAVPGLVWVLGARSLPVLGIAAALYAPHVAWSLLNEGLPWTFQARRGLTGFHLPEALGGQILVAAPPMFAWAVWCWARPRDATERTLRALSLPVLLAWLAASCVTRVEANWPALAWPAAAVLVVRRAPRWLRGASAITAAVVVMVGFGTALVRGSQATEPAIERAMIVGRSGGLPPVAARYQEKAILDLAGPPVAYLRAVGHRPCEYDRVPSGPPAPPCGFVYLADVRALGDRCPGPTEPTSVMGRAATVCHCPAEKP